LRAEQTFSNKGHSRHDAKENEFESIGSIHWKRRNKKLLLTFKSIKAHLVPYTIGLVDFMSFESDEQFGTWAKKMNEAKRIREDAFIYLEQGKYAEAVESFVNYATARSEYGELASVQCLIIEAAETLEMKKAFLEAAKLYLFIANSLRKAQLWGDAITCYQKAGEAYSNISDLRFKTAAAACYVGAADGLAQVKLWSDAERMMTQAAILGTGENLVWLEKNAMDSFKAGDYAKASEIFGRIASAYVASLDQLSDLLPKSGLGEIAMETKSILLHRSSESRVAEAIALLKSDMIPEAKKILFDAAVSFRVALMNLDPLLLVGRPSPSDFRRFAYNLMMSTIIYRSLGEDKDIQAMFNGLVGANEKGIAMKLESLQSYKIAENALKVKTKQSIEELQQVRLGNLEAIKSDIIKGLELIL
jgi:tetratricopeptide (TPR) repeat protein